MRGIVVFAGNAHQELAEEVCQHIGIPLSPTAISRFSNDCIQVQLQASCRGADVFFIQPLCPPVQEHLMELLQMIDAAKGSAAMRLTAVMPYYAYARSDKKDAPRIPITGRLVADLLKTAGADRVLTMALHSPQVHGFFSCPVDHLNALKVLANYFLARGDAGNLVVVSPDLGNAKNAAKFATLLKAPVAAGNKRRISDDRVVIDLVGDVEGKDIIVIDDEIATGGTIVELVERLRDAGVNSISVACTHGLFTGHAIERMRALTDVTEIVTTNTVPIPMAKRLPNMTILSIAPLLAEAIRRTHNGEPISALFE